MRGRDAFNRYKKLIYFLSSILNFFPIKIRIKLFNFFRNTQGTKGLAIRFILLKSIAKNCGDNISIHPNVFLFSIENLSIGNNVSIHPMCYIDCSGELYIGNDVSIAHASTIMTTEHNYNSIEENIKDQDCMNIKTIIKDNIWIGAGCRILAGSYINEGSIIAAGAVLKGNVELYSIYGGVPAKLIKRR